MLPNIEFTKLGDYLPKIQGKYDLALNNSQRQNLSDLDRRAKADGSPKAIQPIVELEINRQQSNSQSTNDDQKTNPNESPIHMHVPRFQPPKINIRKKKKGNKMSILKYVASNDDKQ